MQSWTTSLVADFGLPLLAAVLGSWLWAKYDASDFASQRSIASIQRRIVHLEKWLENFEVIHADPTRYITRIVTLALILLIGWTSIMAIAIMSVITMAAAAEWQRGLWLLLLILLSINFVLYGSEFRAESLPNIYIAKLRQRIQRLRARLEAKNPPR